MRTAELEVTPPRSLVTQNRAHALSERGRDFYETPAAVTRALLKVEPLPQLVWEPACGKGAIVNVLRAAGHLVVASDIADYGVPITTPGNWNRDFFLESAAPLGVECILTNPPFKVAPNFVRHGLTLCRRVILLLRLAFLESTSRSDILEGGKLARVHVIRNRFMMHRNGWQGRRINNSAIPFAWFVWDAAHEGPPTIHRVSWESS
jgi:hypothetical protein